MSDITFLDVHVAYLLFYHKKKKINRAVQNNDKVLMVIVVIVCFNQVRKPTRAPWELWREDIRIRGHVHVRGMPTGLSDKESEIRMWMSRSVHAS